MAKIAINLLPIEFKQEEIKRSKFAKVQMVGMMIILVMTFMTSLTVALRILQSQSIRQVQTRLTQAEEMVSELKGTQGSLILLKNRLGTINQYLGKSSKQSEIYKLIDSTAPQSISVTSISIDQTGSVSMVALARDATSLENFIQGLTSKDTNQEKISQVSVESLNRGRDGIYRVNFKIKPK